MHSPIAVAMATLIVRASKGASDSPVLVMSAAEHGRATIAPVVSEVSLLTRSACHFFSMYPFRVFSLVSLSAVAAASDDDANVLVVF